MIDAPRTPVEAIRALGLVAVIVVAIVGAFRPIEMPAVSAGATVGVLALAAFHWLCVSGLFGWG
jgi:hypothetical protein